MKIVILLITLLSSIVLADSWKKEINGEVKALNELKVTEETKIYTGDIVENDKIHTAPEGKKYVFVPLR